MAGFAEGDTVYFLVSGRIVQEAEVLRAAGDMYTLRIENGIGGRPKGLRLRGARLYASKEEAQAAAEKRHPPKQTDSGSRWRM